MTRFSDFWVFCVHFGSEHCLADFLGSIPLEFLGRMTLVSHNKQPLDINFPGILRHDPSNPGLSTALALEMEHHQNDPKRFWIVLNSDLVLQPKALENLLAASQQNHLGLASGALLKPQGSILCAGSNLCEELLHPISKHRHLPESILDEMPALQTQDFACGAFFVLDSWQLKGFDPRIRLYFEDIELGIRARRGGIQPFLVASARAIHWESLGSGGGMTLRGVILRFKGLQDCLKVMGHGVFQQLLIFAWHAIRMMILWLKGGARI